MASAICKFFAVPVTAVAIAGGLVAAPVQAEDTFRFYNQSPVDFAFTGDSMSGVCMLQGLAGGLTSFTIPAGGQGAAELSWGEWDAGIDCDDVHYSAAGGPSGIPGTSSDFAFYARDPEYGASWLTCTLSGTSALVFVVSVDGDSCGVIAGFPPGAIRPLTPPLPAFGPFSRSSEAGAETRLVSNAAQVKGRTAYVLTGRHGSHRSGKETVVVRSTSGRVLGKTTAKLRVGHPALVPVTLPRKFTKAVTTRKDRRVKVTVRHADKTKGKGDSAVLVLTRNRNIHGAQYPVAK